MAATISDWSDITLDLAGKPRKSRPPSLPEKEPPVILPKELLVGARQLKPEEIGAAVLKAVEESKKVGVTPKSPFGINNPFGVPMTSATALRAYEEQQLAAQLAYYPISLQSR